MTDLRELDRRIEVARLVDRIERDIRAEVELSRRVGIVRSVGLFVVAAIAAGLTAWARRASR